VDTFTNGIKKAAEIIMEDPLGVPLISSWDRVTAAIPDILGKIKKAVEEDNKHLDSKPGKKKKVF